MKIHRPRLLIIGNGMAATRLLEELLALDIADAITVVGEEPQPGYNRILLSPWLAGETELRDVVTHPVSWYQQQDITLLCGDPVIAVDTGRRIAITRSGISLAWDRLVFATGSRAARLRVPGGELANVLGFRSLQDAMDIRARAPDGGRAVVIGGGLLGLEAAHGLNRLGMAVSIVHRGPWLMHRQLDQGAGEFLAATLQARGIDSLTGVETACLQGDSRVTALVLADGRTLPCELAVVAIGIEPETALAREAGLRCDLGICTDRWLQTSVSGIYALGECCQVAGESFGMVGPIYQQAEVLARRLAGREHPGFQSAALSTRLKVSGIELFSSGDLDQLQGCRTLTWQDPFNRHYRRLWLREGKLVATVLFGDTSAGNDYHGLIIQQTAVADPQTLLFGSAVAA